MPAPEFLDTHPRDTWREEPAPDHQDAHTWSLATLVDLAEARADIRGHIQAIAAGHPGDAGEEGAERALLVADEMASNGIRHAGPPVQLAISTRDHGNCYLISVADQSPELLPAPDRHRDPTQGGLGLQMIAAFSDAHGWWPADDGKTVWATLPARVQLGRSRDAAPPGGSA